MLVYLVLLNVVFLEYESVYVLLVCVVGVMVLMVVLLSDLSFV